MSQVNETLCHYIFNQNAEDLFTHLNPQQNQDPKKLNKFVDQCLEIALKVNRHIFAKSDTLPLYSVNAFNEGCHLYCYRVLQLKRTGALHSLENCLEHTDNNRFLLLSFFLSSVLLANQSMGFEKVFFQTMKELGLKRPEGYSKKTFRAFVLDEKKIRENAARQAYHAVFQKYMQKVFTEEKGALFHELNRLAYEDLHVPAKSERFKGQRFYTYPTFAALAFLHEKFKEKEFPVIIKVRVITSEGKLETLRHQLGTSDPSMPALIFEGMASEQLNIETFRQQAQDCAHYYRRKTSHHPEDADCTLCKPAPEEKRDLIDPFKANFEKAMNLDNLLQVFGAEGGNQQECFLPFFQGKYEKLSQIFQAAQPLIQEFGLSEKAPKGFSVFRVYVDTLENAQKSDQPFFEIPPEQFIEQTFFTNGPANPTEEPKKGTYDEMLNQIGTLIGPSAEKLARKALRGPLKLFALANKGGQAALAEAETACADSLKRRIFTCQPAIDVLLAKEKERLLKQASFIGPGTHSLAARVLETNKPKHFEHVRLLLRSCKERKLPPSAYHAALHDKGKVEAACQQILQKESEGGKSDEPLTLQVKRLLKKQMLKRN